MEMIRVGIVGYGNVGRGVELAVKASKDMDLAAVFTRRNPLDVKTETQGVKIAHIDDAIKYKNDIDVMILCGGSAKDLPEQGPLFAKDFNTVDSFDTHAKIPEYFEKIDAAAKDTVSIISVGWDPGLFSMHRLMTLAVLPEGESYTFWGRGVSQGHSDAIRRVEGVLDAIQYTVPVESAIAAVRGGTNPQLGTREKHLRECFVVAKPDADKGKIEQDIKTMPNYFDEYDTVVNFISLEELKEKHSKMPHGGFVIRSGKTGGNSQVVEFSLRLDSNPEFTASVLVAYARAAVKMAKEGIRGAKSVFDVPLSYLLSMDQREQLGKLL